MVDGGLTLQEAADELGVHYMTAYKYVRLGHLDAVKIGGEWRVAPAAIAGLRASRETTVPTRHRHAPWSERLQSRLVAGDSAGAWGVVESAMASGTDVSAIYLDVITPAMREIGTQWAAGEIDISVEHRATGIAARLVGRLGPRCNVRGRAKGTVLIGSPQGERHGLAAAVVADLLRLERWDVCDLGADTPQESFVQCAREVEDLVAIALSVTNPECLDSCAETCSTLRAAGLDAPIVVGGQAVMSEREAHGLGADAHMADVHTLVSYLDGLGTAP